MKINISLNFDINPLEITGDNSYLYITKQSLDGQIQLKLPIHNISTVNGLRDGTTFEHYNVAGWTIKQS